MPLFGTSVAQLRTDRTRASIGEGTTLGRLRFWSQDLHSRGLHAEAGVMTDAANEIEALQKRDSNQRVSGND